MEGRFYHRKAKGTLYSRRCLHWEHIKKRKGVKAKIVYIVNRVQGKHTPTMRPGADLCIHADDTKYTLATPVSTRWTDYQPNQMRSSNWVSYLDATVCLQIYIHHRNNETFCLDCHKYWESWNELERVAAISTGRQEWKRQNSDRYGLNDWGGYDGSGNETQSS